MLPRGRGLDEGSWRVQDLRQRPTGGPGQLALAGLLPADADEDKRAHRIDPALQRLTVGDVIRLVPEGTEPSLRFAVARVEAPHVLVLGPGTSRVSAFAAGLPYPCWTFQVLPTGVSTSRLVVRFQSDFAPTPMNWMMYKYALKPVHFVMERKMMLGVKQRAEHAA